MIIKLFINNNLKLNIYLKLIFLKNNAIIFYKNIKIDLNFINIIINLLF